MEVLTEKTRMRKEMMTDAAALHEPWKNTNVKQRTLLGILQRRSWNAESQLDLTCLSLQGSRTQFYGEGGGTSKYLRHCWEMTSGSVRPPLGISADQGD